MIAIFIQRAYSLRVNNNDIDSLSILHLALDWRAPDPEALRARVHSRPHSESLLLAQDHPVHQVRFARSVKTHHGDHRDWSRYLFYYFQGVRVYSVFCFIGNNENQSEKTRKRQGILKFIYGKIYIRGQFIIMENFLFFKVDITS